MACWDAVNGLTESPTVAALFGSSIVAREYRGIPHPGALEYEELVLVRNATEKRRRQFIAGRLSAKAAIRALGIEPRPVLWDAARAPLWPAGVVGSITHCEGFCGAVVAPRSTYAGIGIDAECRGHVDRQLWPQIMTAAELRQLERLSDQQAREMGTIIFSAKEAFYKCQYQVTAQWLDFQDVEIFIADDGFRVRLTKQVLALGQRTLFKGRFRLHGEHAFTGVSILQSEITGL
jgi:4'-phosphopantetheinyl transferase EntD